MITGKELRMLRINSGQTQAELAKKLGSGGYNDRAIGALENDRRKIGLTLLASWASACGYDIKIEFVKSGSTENNQILDVSLPEDFNEEI